MYAVIKTGGKQYRVAEDDVIEVERLAVEAGDAVEIADVLLIGDDGSTAAGTPLVDGAKVIASVVEHSRGPKVLVFKKKRRKNYRRLAGHRQDLTVLRITDILPDGKAKPAAKVATKKTAAKTAAPVEPATEEKTAKAAPKAKARSSKPKAPATPAEEKD
jgi:large subunit ribosomal protein L21